MGFYAARSTYLTHGLVDPQTDPLEPENGYDWTDLLSDVPSNPLVNILFIQRVTTSGDLSTEMLVEVDQPEVKQVVDR